VILPWGGEKEKRGVVEDKGKGGGALAIGAGTEGITGSHSKNFYISRKIQ